MGWAKRWWLGLGLWPRVALVLNGGFLALFAAFAFLGEQALRESAERILEERLVIAQMASRRIDAVLERAMGHLEQARLFADFDPADPRRTEEAHALAHLTRVGPFRAGVLFLDADGMVVLSHPPSLYLKEGTDLSTYPPLTQGEAFQGPAVSPPFRDPGSGRPVVAVSIPIRDAGGRLIGLLVGLLDLEGPEFLAPLQDAIRLGRTGHAVLVDRQGRAVVSTFALPFLSLGEHHTFYRRALSAGEAVVEAVPFELDRPEEGTGHRHITALAPLRRAPWGVAVGGDEGETFAPVRRLRWGLAVLGGISLVAIWGFSLLGTRFLVRPVHRLMEAAQRIARGDLQVPLEASEGGEIGAMAEALERMRQRLLANIQELEQWSETLEARVQERTEALRRQEALAHQLLRRAITAQEEERRRIAYELHDEVGQTLTAMRLLLDRLDRSVPSDGEVRDRVAQARDLVDRAMADLRRVIAALRPAVLDQLGLLPALRWVADHTLRPLGMEVALEGEGRLPPEVESVLFRIAQEAMNNTARHSGATRVRVAVGREGEEVVMTVQDNGRGFDPQAVVPDPETGRGLGIAGMQERASLLGGRVLIHSAPGQGTTVEVRIPLAPLERREASGGRE